MQRKPWHFSQGGDLKQSIKKSLLVHLGSSWKDEITHVGSDNHPAHAVKSWRETFSFSFSLSFQILQLGWQRLGHFSHVLWLNRSWCLTQYFHSVIYVISLWCQTLPDCFLSDAGVTLGSSSAPSTQQAQTRDQTGAYEVVSASLMNGDLWTPKNGIDSKVWLLLLLFLDFAAAEVLKSHVPPSRSFIQVLSLF